ncbi:hypothetical protein PROFUN_04276 [Planoprotostelium fungivorum]|uniref:Uncharacterized protein n=1 Tax=Planoprotostelium fungivorum TaxID=1890364 RepID=A0A2P6NV12_9EUKA|nr:hypothetical protein PROFUN_04276 [Planoprotostelium fungivorum]
MNNRTSTTSTTSGKSRDNFAPRGLKTYTLANVLLDSGLIEKRRRSAATPKATATDEVSDKKTSTQTHFTTTGPIPAANHNVWAERRGPPPVHVLPFTAPTLSEKEEEVKLVGYPKEEFIFQYMHDENERGHKRIAYGYRAKTQKGAEDKLYAFSKSGKVLYVVDLVKGRFQFNRPDSPFYKLPAGRASPLGITTRLTEEDTYALALSQWKKLLHDNRVRYFKSHRFNSQLGRSETMYVELIGFSSRRMIIHYDGGKRVDISQRGERGVNLERMQRLTDEEDERNRDKRGKMRSREIGRAQFEEKWDECRDIGLQVDAKAESSRAQ